MSLPKIVQFNGTRMRHNDASAEECCTASRLLEDRGEYGKAHALLSDFSSAIGEWPNVDGLPLHLQAAVLLRVGVVAGWVGSAEAIEGAGHFAVELTNAASGLFKKLALNEQAGECHLELGWHLWRAGKFEEASDEYKNALNLLPETAFRLIAKTYLRQGIVHRSTHLYQDALAILERAVPVFEKLEPADILRGGFHNERALVLKNLATSENRNDYLNRALSEYSTALFHVKKARHNGHCAVIENNIGNVHIQLRQFPKAFAHLERAGKLFKALGDVRTFAQVEETRAQALIEQGHYAEAERVIGGTIRTLERACEQSLLCETLITIATAQARQGKADKAYSNLVRAVTEASLINDRANAGRAWLIALEEAATLSLSDEQRRSALTEAASLLEDSQDPKIQSRLLSCAINLATQQMSPRIDNPAPEQIQGVPLKEAVRRFKAGYIRQALNEANGNRSAAARILGMTPSGLHALLEGAYKDIKHEGLKKYNKSYIRPVVDQVAERRAQKAAKTNITKRDGSVEIELPTDHLAGIGPRAGDWVVAEEGPVKSGDLTAVQLKSGTAAVGFYRRAGKRIILDVRNLHFTEFEYDESEIANVIGKVYGWQRAGEEDTDTLRSFD